MMSFALDLIQKIPAGWPRFMILVAVAGGYFLFPSIFKKMSRDRKRKEELALLIQFLQAKKLIFETRALQREKNLEDFQFPGEIRLMDELMKPTQVLQPSRETMPYRRRLLFALLGSVIFLLLTTLLAYDRFEGKSGMEVLLFILKNTGTSLGCGLIASFFPLRSALSSAFYGFTMPFALVLVYASVIR